MVSQATHSSFDLVERQQAFVGLLTAPLLTRDRPELHRLVTRHRRELTRWLGHLGYRLTTVGHTHRLRRCTLPGVPVVLPSTEVPDRRVLVLLLVLAAVLEDVQSDSIDIQSLSDGVRDTVAVQGLTPYDPQRRADRRLLVAAVRRAEEYGVLRRLTREELLSNWEESGEGVPAGYRVNRHALFLLVDPIDVATARTGPEIEADEVAGPEPPGADPRGRYLLRVLIETQGLRFAALTPAQLDYWTRQRHRLISRVVELTGGSVEVNADCATVILPTDHRAARESTESFPAAKASHWVTLKLLDLAARSELPDSDGRLRWLSAAVDEGCETIAAQLGDRLVSDLRDNPRAVRAAAESALTSAGLLSIDAGGWWLSPLAARYRSADLTVSARTATALEEDT